MNNWWENAVIYQIYPRSFQDSNQDGIGDLRGIINRLDYLATLGIDAIWISPIYPSPMVDNGYDISDYKDIDPIFGTLADFKELLAKAHKLNIKIIMDLVLNHCSTEHEWFQDILKNPDSPYKDYFIIKEGKNGGAPNNWRSNFGGSAWERINDSNKFYLHVFSKEQADLNWENPNLRRELYEMIHWWINLGVDGFRIDAINFIKKNQDFPNLSPDGPDGLADPQSNWLNAEGIGDFLQELKVEGFENGKIFTVAEANNVRPDQIEDFIGENGYFTCIFDFSYTDMDIKAGDWFRPVRISPMKLKNNIFSSQENINGHGLAAPYLENHDQNRSPNKFLETKDINFQSKSSLALMYFFLQGVPFIYQGQELGMTNYPWASIEQFNDVSTYDQFARALSFGLDEDEAFKRVSKRSRDNARIPMLWSKALNAGFSEVEPWLPVHPDYKKINVESEIKQTNSLLNFYRKMIEIRKNSAGFFTKAKFKGIKTHDENLIAYKRQDEDKEYLVLVNLQDKTSSFDLLNQEEYIEILNNYNFYSNEATEHKVPDLKNIKPFESILLKKKEI